MVTPHTWKGSRKKDRVEHCFKQKSDLRWKLPSCQTGQTQMRSLRHQSANKTNLWDPQGPPQSKRLLSKTLTSLVLLILQQKELK